MSRRLYCAHCHGVWYSSAAHGMAQDLERCLKCGGPLTLDHPAGHKRAQSGRPPAPERRPPRARNRDR